MNKKLHERYDYIFEPELLKAIEMVAVARHISKGETVIDIGQPITKMPLLLTGAIKVLREDAQGDELLVYFLEKGDSCAMTFSCCLGNKKSEIRAVAETDSELLMIPVEKMQEWMGRFHTWRNFVLDSYHIRMMELLETVDTLAFMKMDERLLKYLQDKAKVNQDDIVHTTHRDIATDMHTSRVVVSRLLKKLEGEGKLIVQRNRLKILEL
ncbi:Crp/Fnr family transcriptional regulator [Maribacter sp. 2-571]|uniref:Crp/Fnr family transcriptional regulator n=1 Tax=Maribacter sp. 2-571 TaxID=3417569 RepID=UPI003D34CCBF